MPAPNVGNSRGIWVGCVCLCLSVCYSHGRGVRWMGCCLTMQRAVLHYPSVPEAIQLILAQFKSVTKEIGLINVLTRLVEAVTAVDKVPASLAPRVRSIAARHHAENDDRWTPAVQRQFAEAVECINAKTVSDNGEWVTVTVRTAHLVRCHSFVVVACDRAWHIIPTQDLRLQRRSRRCQQRKRYA